MKLKCKHRGYISSRSGLFYFAAAILWFLASSVQAGTATCTQGTTAFPMNVGIPNFTPDLAIGGEIKGAYSYAPSEVAVCTFTADTSANRELDYIVGSDNADLGVYNDAETFATNLAGVGVQLGADLTMTSNVTKDNDKATVYFIPPGNNKASGRFTISSTNEKVTLSFIPRVRLIKTSGAVEGGILSGVVGYVAATADRVPAQLKRTTLYITGTVNASGCEVSSTKEVNIVLDDVQKSNLPEVNSTWGQSSPHNIQLNCSKGTTVGITFSGIQSSDSATDASVLQNNGSAQGIGVQLLKSDGTPYVLGTRVAISSSAGASVNIPVSARYIRTGDMVAGSVTSSATYTLDYE
ncbi:fimbrial protein [Pseudescherichia sp.]|uniref:fimbrial protein n=1 Tax=Pseudescherichia sp. TaxID=2055881 RepID=UPI0028A153BE|nr:fimbrial protein [Pseudescherichia sp.]